ncbi:unnamed protein product [Camellia sinensis]
METEIKRFEELVKKERMETDSERRKADAERKEANEARKIMKAEKRRAAEERRLADTERKKVEENRIQLEKLKREADEARSKLVLEAFKSEEANKMRQLMRSQERGAFSVTTSAKLAEEKSSSQPNVSSLSGEVTKTRYNENLAVVAENSVRSPISTDTVGRTGHSKMS